MNCLKAYSSPTVKSAIPLALIWSTSSRSFCNKYNNLSMYIEVYIHSMQTAKIKWVPITLSKECNS